MTKVSLIKPHLVQAYYWLREGRVAWLALVFGVVLLIGLCLSPLERMRRLALAGMVFQLVGVGVSALVIGRLRRTFGLERITKGIAKYFMDARYIFICRPPIHANAAGKIGEFVQVARAVTYAQPTGTVYARLSEVENQMRNLRSSLDTVSNGLADVEQKLSAAITKERSARDAGLAKIDNKLKAAMVGDWQLAFVGLAYLLVGIVLGTLPALF
jgi:hypothetical protein